MNLGVSASGERLAISSIVVCAEKSAMHLSVVSVQENGVVNTNRRAVSE